MKKSYCDLQPGDVLWDMHDTPRDGALRIREPYEITQRITIRTTQGSELITDALRGLVPPHWYYVNKLLVVLDKQDGKITAAWSYDGFLFGVCTIKVEQGAYELDE